MINDCVARYIIRKARKDKGLRQEDLSDKSVSYGTISNIERGSKKVDDETIRKYLIKLGLTENRVINFAKQEKEAIESLTIQLEAIESMLDHDKLEKSIQLLKAIDIERFHPLAPYYTYLEGRSYQAKRQWEKAEKYYKFAIRLRNQYNLPLKENIISICYNELGICSYLQSNIKKALSYIEKGLNAYNHEENSKQIVFSLNSNKVFYLLNLGRYESAKQVLNELWSSVPEIQNINIVLNLYRYNALLLRKMGRYTEAAEICKQGIDIARNNRIRNRYLDLMNVLGSIYLAQNHFEKAKQQFDIILNYDFSSISTRTRIDTLILLTATYANMDEWLEAEKTIHSALKLARDKQVIQLYKALIVAGDIYLAKDKYSEAVTYYEEAERSGDKKIQHLALLQLSNCFDKMGLENKWKICTKQLLKLQQELELHEEVSFHAFI